MLFKHVYYIFDHLCIPIDTMARLATLNQHEVLIDYHRTHFSHTSLLKSFKSIFIIFIIGLIGRFNDMLYINIKFFKTLIAKLFCQLSVKCIIDFGGRNNLTL